MSTDPLAKIPDVEQRRAWAEAHNALVSLRGLEAEAEMYASPSSYEALSEAITDITFLARSISDLSEQTENTEGLPVPKRLYEIAFKMLYHAASSMATDVREHLRLPELPREWRLYDGEFRELQAELAQLREKGLDYSADSAPTTQSKTPPRPRPGTRSA